MRRPSIHGRSIMLGGRKLHVRGVTYGTFRESGGVPFPSPEVVRRDFESMVDAGANALRTYVPPPVWLLDLAHDHGLRVTVGLAWEQHVAFLDDRELSADIVARVGRQVAECAAHPAILCYALGNEIPAQVVRWHGKRKVERFLEGLYRSAKEQDPGALFTYVNYPSTEYLELPFLDLAAFNVFLEEESAFESYVARLQNLAGDRPLLVTELGIDSSRNGEERQARTLRWQVRHAFGTGAAGVFVFSWTDEWHRGGHEVTDWDFGLVDRARRPKPALSAVRDAFAGTPFPVDGAWPKVSVVVCTHNGACTLPECLAAVARLGYPDYELIVVNDGSTDASAKIARAHGAEVVEIDHRGLSAARNAGIERAGGEIVAFLDDDAYPDGDWLHYVAASLRANGHGGVGGPNLPPRDEGMVAACVAAAPGGPIHVLVSDREAEHVPGCNMAFRKSALEAIGGFDERFRTAGDDVDVCWRLQEAGWTLGFSAGAVVMHRRRDSVRRYLKQQYGYGKAEALLERKWPSRYNRVGSSRWSGRIYDGAAGTAPGRRGGAVRYGTWGSGLFQSIYEPAPGALANLLLAPEILLVLASLAVVSALGAIWPPLLTALPLFLAGSGFLLWRAVLGGWRAHRPSLGHSRFQTLRRRLLTSALFLLQPAARLAGRLRKGLSPWRQRLGPSLATPRARTVEVWSESWREPADYVAELQAALLREGGYVHSGGAFDRWDLYLRAGPLGGAKMRAVVEEHGSGRQLARFAIHPRWSLRTVCGSALFIAGGGYALADGQATIAAALGLVALLSAVLALGGTGASINLALRQVTALRAPQAEPVRVDPLGPVGEPARHGGGAHPGAAVAAGEMRP